MEAGCLGVKQWFRSGWSNRWRKFCCAVGRPGLPLKPIADTGFAPRLFSVACHGAVPMRSRRRLSAPPWPPLARSGLAGSKLRPTFVSVTTIAPGAASRCQTSARTGLIAHAVAKNVNANGDILRPIGRKQKGWPPASKGAYGPGLDGSVPECSRSKTPSGCGPHSSGGAASKGRAQCVRPSIWFCFSLLTN